jgi:hypothetical protein
MINHENKIIELGYGDVCVGGSWSGLTFQNIKPPQEVGTHLFRGQDNINFIGDIIDLPMPDIREISEFEVKLSKVEDGERDFIAFTDWVIKFNGNKGSAKVVRLHFECLKSRVLNCLAC